MSYGFTVVSNGKVGELEISAGYGDLPFGTWDVIGHISPATTVAGGSVVVSKAVEVTLRDKEGELVISAQHHETRKA